MEDFIEYAILDDDTAEISRYEGSSQTIAIPESLDGYPVTAIGDGAFAGSKSMRFLSIPQSIRIIGSGAFRQCTALQSVIIPQGTQSIGSEAFKDCSVLTSVSLPSSLQTLDAEAFRGCRSLQSISIPSGITEIADRVLSGCSSLISVTLPDTITRIGWGAFSKCTSLESICIPKDTQEIAGDAFFSCSALCQIALPDNLVHIRDRVFYECTSLRHLCVPSSVQSIGSGAFYGCTDLTLVAAPGSYAQSYAQSNGIAFAHGCFDGFDYLIANDGTAEILRYDGDAQKLVIPDVIEGHSVCVIGDRAFRFLSHIAAVDLPDCITSIGSGAFHGCTSLASLRLSSGLIAIGSDAFKSCSALQSLSLPSGVKTLGGYAFYGCTSLEEITLPNDMNEIGSFTFCGCSALRHVSLPENLERIGMSAFNGCISLAALNLPDPLISIGAKAFKDCRALASVNLSDGIHDIGRDAFAGCASLILHLSSDSFAHQYAAQENLSFVFTHIDAPALKGVITDKTEFLFPDTPLGDMPARMRIACAKNGRRGIQILFECAQKNGSIRVIAPQFDTEIHQMIDVPVEYNTGNGVDQGGAMVLLPDHCPDYAVRKAPFRVYDCLRPSDGKAIPAKDGHVSAYVTFAPKDTLCAGKHSFYIELKNGDAMHVCEITCRVYPVCFNEDLFETTNWFSIAAMEQMHHVRRGTPEFNDVVRAYARSMRRVHQKIFLLWMHEDLSERRTQKPYHFDFEDMKPIIEIFFEEGFDTFETGGIICRGYRPDGSQDMYTADFKCSANPSVSVDSAEGYELLCCEMKAFADFLRRNNWQDRVLFHVMDEPDVHYKSDADLMARRVQFFMAANIVRRYLPGVRIIEAVKTTLMRGGVDIMVPITDSYQLNKQAFDDAIAMGDEVYTYVCCAPEGKWLNRFLDQPLINGRLLFWGCALSRITGYLHWGYNQFGGVSNPFEATSARNWTGIGTNFPCGDAFIVYPGENGPWLSMRLEAERQGAQEAAMLRALLMRDPAAHDALITRVFRSFDEYDNTPETLDALHEELLSMLEKTETPL